MITTQDIIILFLEHWPGGPIVRATQIPHLVLMQESIIMDLEAVFLVLTQAIITVLIMVQDHKIRCLDVRQVTICFREMKIVFLDTEQVIVPRQQMMHTGIASSAPWQALV